MKRVWSKSQLQVINSEDKTILVSASAGSGKTSVMIERIVTLIGKGASVRQMLVCTFTKASAYDMRSKLYGEMARRGLGTALKDLSGADICTIDSFCQKLVTRYFYVLGVDPQFEVLDETDSSSMKFEAAERSIAESDDPNLARLATYMRRKRRNNALRQAIISYIDFVGINPDCSPEYRYDREAVGAALDDYLRAKKQNIKDAIYRCFAEADEPELMADMLTALETGVCSFSRKRLKAESEFLRPCADHLKDRIRAFASRSREISELRPQSESRELIEAFLGACARACEIYAAEKSKRSAVDFCDLENMALTVLRSDVADEIRQKYRYVFIDEYQDINPLQEAILSLVSRGNDLFMVGDLKQSIYAFRGCEPDIFKAKYDAYKSGKGEGKAFNLDDNFRSSKQVVSFVNRVFGAVMTEDFGGINYRANPMTATSGEDGFVGIHLITGKEQVELPAVYSVKSCEDTSLGKAEAQATLVAIRVKSLLEQGAKFSDIAILSRSMGAAEALVINKLREINVPVSLTENAYFLSRPETGQLIAFMRLIDNRLDDKAMATAMLSPIGGFDENELAALRLEGDGNFYECVTNSDDDKVKGFLDKLERYFKLSLAVNADELAETIVSDEGYFNYAYGLKGPAVETLDKFLEYLSTCPCKNSLAATIRYIDEHDPFAELSGADESVKFMTVHKSKGLEFKYVLLIGLNEPFNFRDLSAQIFVGNEIAMNVYDDHEAKNSDLKALVSIGARKKQLEEELRILYVAMTRARTGLEIFATLGDDKALAAYRAIEETVDLSESNNALRWLAPVLDRAEIYDISDISITAASPRKVLFGKADEALVAQLERYFDFSAAKNAPAKSYVSKLAHKDDEPAPVLYDEEGSDSDDALERGNSYHRAMELIDFASPDLGVLTEADARLVDKDKLLAAAAYMATLRGTLYKEKPFMLKLSASEAGLDGRGDVLVQGVIDLLAVDGDCATIVDYKTGKPHGRFEAGYIKQVGLYALAVERILGLKVVRKFLYYFDGGVVVEV